METAAQILPPPAGNIVPLPSPKKTKPLARPQRFRIVEYQNRSGNKSWRVTGIKRNGERIRENFTEIERAQCRQVDLETEYLRGHAETSIRATKLSEDQIQLAEAAFLQLGDDWERILDAVSHWKLTGNKKRIETPRLDDAFEQYKAWLTSPACKMREHSKTVAKGRVRAFIDSTPNIRVSEVTTEMVEKFLKGIPIIRTRINKKYGVSHFFSWCIESERRWITVNPCSIIRIRATIGDAPTILSVTDCERIARAAQKFEGGKLVPYIVLTMFEGLRPFEARRIRWDQINLKDRELRLEPSQTKTKRGRSFTLTDTGALWLESYKATPIHPKNFANLIPKLLEEAGYGTATEEKPHLKRWTKDVLRHTAISHYFRKTGSYGLTAERFGNSETIIKRHYQGRVSTDETAKFYGIKPTKKGSK